MREIIHSNSGDQLSVSRNMDVINLDPSKKLYGVIVENKIFMATLCELPNIIEGQKTLDFRTFYKSVDVSQILYVHNKVIEEYQTKSPEELVKIAKDYNPVLEDNDFLNNIYRRGETKKMVEEMKNKNEEVKYECLKFRHGLAPVSKNIRNIRHKKEPNEDQEEVHGVEKILKDIIDYGFADNVEEELLEFDDNGDLKNVTKGAKEKRKEISNSNVIHLDFFNDQSAKSESNYQPGQYPYGADGQSSMYSVPVDQFDDGTSYRQDTVYNENGGGDTEQNQAYPQMQIQRNQSSAQNLTENQYMSAQQQQFNQSAMSNQGNFSASQFLNQQQQQNIPVISNFTPTFDQSNLFQQQQYNQSQQQVNDFNNMQQQQQQFNQNNFGNDQQQNQIQDFQPPSNTSTVIYTQQNYLQMKQDIKELKRLIKTTKKDITDGQQKGIDILELREYYRKICQQKDELKANKKIAKRQIRNQNKLQQQQQQLQNM